MSGEIVSPQCRGRGARVRFVPSDEGEIDDDIVKGELEAKGYVLRDGKEANASCVGGRNVDAFGPKDFLVVELGRVGGISGSKRR